MRIPERKPHASGNDRCRWKRKDYYFGPTGSEESDRRYKAWVRSILEDGTPMPSLLGPCSCTNLVLRFLSYAKRKYSRGEYDNCRSACKVLLAEDEYTPASQFGPVRLAAVRDAMVKAGWPRSRVNAQVCRIRRMFRWGVSQELVNVHTVLALRELMPLRRGETVARESSPVRSVDAALIEKVAKKLLPTPAAMVRVQALVGMRPSELFAMRPADIDRTDDIWVYRPQKHKMAYTGKVVGYAIGPRAQRILKPFLKRPATTPLFRPAETALQARAKRAAERKTPDNEQARQRRKKTPAEPKLSPVYNRNSFRNVIARAVDRLANGDRDKFDALYFRPNQLRHARATTVNASHGIEAARVTLNHSNINTTTLYAEADLAKAKQVARESG